MDLDKLGFGHPEVDGFPSGPYQVVWLFSGMLPDDRPAGCGGIAGTSGRESTRRNEPKNRSQVGARSAAHARASSTLVQESARQVSLRVEKPEDDFRKSSARTPVFAL